MKLLWISNDPRLLNVGQSRVAREILSRLKKAGVDVHATAVGVSPFHTPVDFPIHAMGHCKDYPKDLIAALQPEVIVLSHDCWLFYWLAQCKQDFPNIKLVGYYTIDGGPIHGSWIQTMQPLDLLVSPTWFGRKEIYARYPEKHVGVIPYGVDHNFFVAPESKIEEKREVDLRTSKVAENGVMVSNKAIFTFVGQNQGRKNIAAVLEGFEMANIPNSHLFCVTHCHEQELGGWRGMGECDLIDLIGTFEHRERITVSIEPADEIALKSLYRFSDFFVLPSQGEAPGLPILEAMACGCIPIVTDYAGSAEVAAGYKLPYTFFRGQFNVNRAMVSANAVANGMLLAYNSTVKGENIQHSKACVETAKQFSWDKTASVWMHYLTGLMEGRTSVDTTIDSCL